MIGTMSLSAAEQKELEGILEKKQIQDQLRLYNSITSKCFSDCVDDFGGRALVPKEDLCMRNCVSKFVLSHTRLMQRFAELQSPSQ